MMEVLKTFLFVFSFKYFLKSIIGETLNKSLFNVMSWLSATWSRCYT